MNAWLLELLLVAIGGAGGGAARFWISGLVTERTGETFPWGTMAVNVSGAACIGIVAGLLLLYGSEPIVRHSLWAALVAGLLGSYTTVSSFSLQTLALLHQGEAARALANVLASLLLCITAAAAGYAAVAALAGVS